MDEESPADDGADSVRAQLSEALRTADRLGDTLLAARICEALEVALADPTPP